MYSTYYAIFLTLPTLSWSFSCQYNESSTISRKTILLELEGHNYVHIYDASYEIKLQNETKEFKPVSNKDLQFIESIQFRGYITEGGVNKYIETTLTSLISYRYSKTNNICRISYQEAKNTTLDLTFEQETAILRLAQSCIQSKVCGVDLMKIDRNADLYYQSIQSSINELLDFYAPKLLDSFLLNDKSFHIPTIDVNTGQISFYVKSGVINGLDAVQRVSDVFVKPESSKYVVDFKIRFPKIKVYLNQVSAKYKKMSIYGNSIAQIQGASLSMNIVLDLHQQNCSVKLKKIGELAFKNITLDIPLWGFRLFTYRFNSHKLYNFEIDILNNIVAHIPQLKFDCKKYIEKFTEILNQ